MTVDVQPAPSPDTSLYSDVIAGLKQTPKTLDAKYLYDRRGSQLFDQICDLPEYYLTRTELALTRDHADDIAALVGSRARLVELGAGSAKKSRFLLNELHDLAAYVPVEISEKQLAQSVSALSDEYPDLPITALCTDFTQPFELPRNGYDGRTAFYYPGSTIGNFAPQKATEFLYRLAQLGGPRGALIIGVDLVKDRAVLEAAYNDEAGVTADFNRNLLRRLNRECDADFDLDQFRHQAVYQDDFDRIEMRLISQCDQRVHFPTQTFAFEQNEPIITEHSYKFTVESFSTLAEEAHWRTRAIWTDNDQMFSLWFLERGELN